MLKTNIKIAFRKLLNKREFTFINVMGLAVGLTASLLIFLWVDDELKYDAFHIDSDRTYMVLSNNYEDNGDISTQWVQSGAIKNALGEGFPEVDRVLRVEERTHQLTVGDKSFKDVGVMADEEFFQVFNFPFIKGELTENSLATDGDIILTESMALKLFDKVDVIGELVKIDNSRDAIVRGVVADPPKNSRFEFSFAISMEGWIARNNWVMRWGNSALMTFVQLKPRVDADEFNSKVEGLIRENAKGNTKSLFLKPFDEVYLYGSYRNGEQSGGRIEYVRLFMLIGGVILIIACINYVNISIADAFNRTKEVAVRKVTGASKWTLTRHFLIESGLVVGLALVLAIVTVETLIGPFNDLTGKNIELKWLGSDLLLILCGLGLFTVFTSGMYPALMLSQFNIVKALKGKVDVKGTTKSGSIIRKGLVVFQFVIAGLLIFATLIVNQQVDFILNNQKNVDKEGVIILYNHDDLLEKYESFRNELLNEPSIQHVTVVGDAPVNIGASTGDFSWKGKDPLKDKTSFRLMFTDPGFVPTMNLKMVEGRNFSRDLASDAAGVVINEAAARGMNVENPVGMPAVFWGYDVKIIGVVQDFHLASVYEEIAPLVLINLTSNSDYVTIRTAKGQEQQALAALERKYAEFMPGYLFEYRFLSEEHKSMYQGELLTQDLVKVFSLIAICISCLGLFGLTSINAQRSVKEIGIRKVLGASIRQILISFSRQSLVLPLMAVIIMVPLAFYIMSSWLADFQYHIEISSASLAIVVLLSLIIAWLTVSIIAFRAARTNPVNSLRNE